VRPTQQRTSHPLALRLQVFQAAEAIDERRRRGDRGR
jgi:hypothetical protein